jgi:hypothetical protein
VENLIRWLLICSQDGSGKLVVRKLCSALSTYFIHFSDRWSSCVPHLLHCLGIGRSVPYTEFQPSPEHSVQIARGLSPAGLQAALWFASALAEDVGKVDMNTPQQ